jgi:hypothetical protein
MEKRWLLVFEHLLAFKSMYGILDPLSIFCSMVYNVEMLILGRRILAITAHTMRAWVFLSEEFQNWLLV